MEIQSFSAGPANGNSSFPDSVALSLRQSLSLSPRVEPAPWLAPELSGGNRSLGRLWSGLSLEQPDEPAPSYSARPLNGSLASADWLNSTPQARRERDGDELRARSTSRASGRVASPSPMSVGRGEGLQPGWANAGSGNQAAFFKRFLLK